MTGHRGDARQIAEGPGDPHRVADPLPSQGKALGVQRGRLCVVALGPGDPAQASERDAHEPRVVERAELLQGLVKERRRPLGVGLFVGHHAEGVAQQRSQESLVQRTEQRERFLKEGGGLVEVSLVRHCHPQAPEHDPGLRRVPEGPPDRDGFRQRFHGALVVALCRGQEPGGAQRLGSRRGRRLVAHPQRPLRPARPSAR